MIAVLKRVFRASRFVSLISSAWRCLDNLRLMLQLRDLFCLTCLKLPALGNQFSDIWQNCSFRKIIIIISWRRNQKIVNGIYTRSRSSFIWLEIIHFASISGHDSAKISAKKVSSLKSSKKLALIIPTFISFTAEIYLKDFSFLNVMEIIRKG